MPTFDGRRERQLAHAKLTRTLRVVGRRADGYHLLESEMVSLDLADELELSACDVPAGGAGELLEVVDAVGWPERRGGGPPAGGGVPEGGANLVAKALDLVGLAARVRLVKRIPAGAGLGGGSSDAAAVLRWAGVEDPAVAVQLGADVPFCLSGGRALVSGIGDRVRPLPFVEASCLLLTPPVAQSTALVYSAFDRLGVKARGEGPNELEAAALAVSPALARWRDLVGEVTGRPPVLAGSGSTWFLECSREQGEAWEQALSAAVAEEGTPALVRLCRTVGAQAGRAASRPLAWF